MALIERKTDVIDGQTDFSGGAMMIGEPAQNQYRYATNIIVRRGPAETRPGMRRAFRVLQEGFQKAFWFGDKGDGTGFWFDAFSFVASAWGNIQATKFFRFPDDTYWRQILVSAGNIFVHNRGYVEEVSAIETIGSDEVIHFVQANQYLVMIRGDGNNVLRWDGSSSGFQLFPAGETNDIPQADNGAYINGRLWLVKDRDDIYASADLSIEEYDFTYRLFSIRRGDGDEVMLMYPFHEDYCLTFKKHSWHYLLGVNAVVLEGTHLSDYMGRMTGSNDIGLVAPKAVVTTGEQVHFLSYRGITSIARTEEGKLIGKDVPLSAPIQPLIDRINWDYVSGACAGQHDNYLLFSVPLDDATDNNVTLVYDLLGNGGKGCWLPVWESDLLRPTEYFNEEDKLYFIGSDGAMRIMFQDDPWDTEDVFDDTPVYNSATQYFTGARVYFDNQGDDWICRALIDCQGVSPTDTDTWVRETDPQNLHRIESELRTRFYRHGDSVSTKDYGVCQVLFKHQNPKITVEIESENYGTLEELFTDITYDRTKYDVANTPDWDPSNVNLDFADPHRRDYSVFIGRNVGVRLDYNNVSYYYPKYFYLSGFGNDTDGRYGLGYNEPDNDLYQGIVWLKEGTVVADGKFIAVVAILGEASWNIAYSAAGDTIWPASPRLAYGAISDDAYQWPSPAASSGRMFASVLHMDSGGITLGIWTPHDLRCIPSVVNNQAFALRISNTQGKLAVTSIVHIAQLERFAGKAR